MSVILDALRKARGGQAPRPPVARPASGIPAGLRPGSSNVASGRPSVASGFSRKNRKSSGTNWPMLAGVVVIAAVIYAGVRFGLPLLQQNTPIEQARLEPATEPAPAPTAAPTAPAAEETPAPAAVTDTGARITEMVEAITAPPAVAPRALPNVTPERRGGPSSGAEASAKAAGPPRPPAPRPAPARPPVRTTPAPELTLPAATAAAPAPAVDHFELAVRYHTLGNFEQALAHYTSALQAEEFNVEARNNLGLLYRSRGLTAEAIEQFRRAILIDPQYTRARSNLAVVLMDAGRLAEARAELRAALAIDPRNVDLLVNMALVDKADRLPDLARETLLRALGIEPAHASAHYNLAVLYDEAGETARAHSHYAEFLKSAGPEHGSRLSDVERRIEALAPRIDQ